MARRVFFSFDYEKDKWRAGQVRNSSVTKSDRQTAGFWDAVAWEKLKRKGGLVVKRWIDNQLLGTSVTVVLIGARTATRKWVKYEIKRSIEAKKGLLGIWIHNVKDQRGRRDVKGDNLELPRFCGQCSARRLCRPIAHRSLEGFYCFLGSVTSFLSGDGFPTFFRSRQRSRPRGILPLVVHR